VIQIILEDPLEVSVELITRSRGEKAQICIQWVYLEYLANMSFNEVMRVLLIMFENIKG